MGRELKIIVKAPNHKIEDQIIICDSDWNVLKLKEEISIIYPHKPTVEGQRLIYSGHLLKNEQRLADLLQSTSDDKNTDEHTFHLVCSQKHTDTVKQNPRKSQTTPLPVNNIPTNLDGDIGNQSQPSNETGNVATTIGFAPLNDFSVMPPMMTNPEQMMQQMVLMQQMYAQYMQQFLSQNLANYPTNVPLINPATGNGIGTSTPPNIQVPVQPVQQPPPQPPQQAAMQQQPPQPAQEAVGGVAAAIDDEDDPNNRDWLDWFYYLSRASILLSIVYFYSSLSRFIAVIGVGILLYLYQIGIFAAAPRPPPQPENPGNQERYDNRDENNDEEGLQAMMDGNLDGPRRRRRARDRENTEDEIDDPPQPTDERYAGFRMIWMMVTSLFTSLIPEAPVPMNIN